MPLDICAAAWLNCEDVRLAGFSSKGADTSSNEPPVSLMRISTVDRNSAVLSTPMVTYLQTWLGDVVLCTKSTKENLQFKP